MCLTPLGLHHQYVLFVIKSVLGEWALSMVEVEEGHDGRNVTSCLIARYKYSY